MIIIYTSFFFLLILYLLFEYIFLRVSLTKIPIRILVNGTRGKSTIVKILYQIILTNHYCVFAKTTGNQPIEYTSGGESFPIKRMGPASIIENIRILRRWAKHKPRAIIMECMALHPENQKILSKMMIRPTHTIITNVLNDHHESMGNTLPSIYHTMQESLTSEAIKIIPEGIRKYTTTKKNTFFFSELAFAKKYPNIPEQIINQSWDLISKMCEQLDLDLHSVETCFAREWDNVNEKIRIKIKQRNFEFWDLFSINDIDSLALFCDHILDLYTNKNKILLIFNTRADRPLRTKSIIPQLCEYFSNNTIMLIGSGKKLAKRLLHNASFHNSFISHSGKIIQQLNAGFERQTVVIGLGNHLGVENILKELESTNTGGQS